MIGDDDAGAALNAQTTTGTNRPAGLCASIERSQ
jgi:hypothetical protein